MTQNPTLNPALAALAFTGIGGAKARMDANYERPGHYWERIDKIKLDKTRKDEVFFVIEKTVIHVWNPGRPEDHNPGQKGHAVGEACSHMMMKKHESFLGNLRQFLEAVMQMPSTATEAELFSACTAICGDAQPLRGTVVEVNNRNITTRKNLPFTTINYKREVPAAEVLATLSPQNKDLFFPGGFLESVVAAEAAVGATA